MNKVLTIAGSDSSAGAGIQADLKTFASLGVYGTCAITAITAQNTCGVNSIFELPAKIVSEQIDAIMEDIGADAWKTGMLVNKEIITVVCQKAKKYKVKFLVVDPVMVSKSGAILLRKDAQETLIKKLFPLAFVVTPNLDEVQAILKKNIKTIKEMKEAATFLWKMGSKNVLVKGGHLQNNLDAVDILYDGKTFFEFCSKRIKSKNTHGTGCTFSSAISAELAKGLTIQIAVERAKDYITKALISSKNFNIGKGIGPLVLWSDKVDGGDDHKYPENNSK